MKKLILIAVAALLSSCAAVPFVITSGVVNGLQYGIKDPVKRAEVACQMVNVSGQLQIVTTVPTVMDFRLLLDKYLPNNESKTITESNLVALYALELPVIQKKAPTDQIAEFKVYLDAVHVGASTFCVAETPY